LNQLATREFLAHFLIPTANFYQRGGLGSYLVKNPGFKQSKQNWHLEAWISQSFAEYAYFMTVSRKFDKTRPTDLVATP
jgi:hypothetical protein